MKADYQQANPGIETCMYVQDQGIHIREQFPLPLPTYGLHQHEISMQAAGDKYFGSDDDCSCCSYTVADCKHSKDSLQIKAQTTGSRQESLK